MLADVTASMECRDGETFGPVVAIYVVGSDEQAIDLANDTDYGLNASVWTRDVRRGRDLASRIRCGTVQHQRATPPYGSASSPMGGMKQSGIGRRHGRDGILKFTEAQTIAAQHVIGFGGIPGSPMRPSPRASRSACALSGGRPSMTGGYAAGAGSAPAARCCHRITRRPRRGRCRSWSSAPVSGSSVAALRLAEGWSVLVLGPGDASPTRTSPRPLGTSRTTCGRQGSAAMASSASTNCRRRPVLAGAGVGGGSLNYANTLYRPPRAFCEDPQWRDLADWEAELAPHYDTASRMLGVVDENPCDGPVEQVMKRAAGDLGVGGTYRRLLSGSSSAPPVSPCPTLLRRRGPGTHRCTMCGNCMVGCRVGDKNTLVKNYLALAEGLGVHIEPMRTVTHLGRSRAPAGPTGARHTESGTGRPTRGRRNAG